MGKQQKGEGLISAAGLIRYFDAEEKTSLQRPPWLVIGMCVVTIVVVTIIHIVVKL